MQTFSLRASMVADFTYNIECYCECGTVAQIVWTGYPCGVWYGRWWPAGLYRELPQGGWELQGVGIYRGVPIQ
jgi:hypothetical protein